MKFATRGMVEAKRLARNVWLDVRFGGRFLGGTIKTSYGNLGAHNIVNTDYGIMPYLFKDARIIADDVLVDVGCGKGRVINWWLAQGLKNELIGVEIDEKIALQTKHRLRKYKNVVILAGSILDVFPPAGTIFFLYNPFSETILREFEELLYKQGASNVRIIYYISSLRDPLHKHVFSENHGWITQPICLPRSEEHLGAKALLVKQTRH